MKVVVGMGERRLRCCEDVMGLCYVDLRRGKDETPRIKVVSRSCKVLLRRRKVVLRRGKVMLRRGHKTLRGGQRDLRPGKLGFRWG